MVSKLYSRPRRNSSASAGLLGRWRGSRASAPRSSSSDADPPGRLAAHAGGRLEHDRQADLGDERLGVGPRAEQAVARARQAVAAQLVLHARLVAEQLGGLGAGARARRARGGPRRAGPAAARGCRARGGSRRGGARSTLRRPRSAGAVSSPSSTVDEVGEQPRRRRRAAAPARCRAAGRRRAAAAARANRIVVSSGNGATNTTLRMLPRCNMRALDEGRVPRAELPAGDAAVHPRARRGRRRGLRRRRHAGRARCRPRSSSTSPTTCRSRASSTRTTWSRASTPGCAAARSIACSRTGRSWC